MEFIRTGLQIQRHGIAHHGKILVIDGQGRLGGGRDGDGQGGREDNRFHGLVGWQQNIRHATSEVIRKSFSERASPVVSSYSRIDSGAQSWSNLGVNQFFARLLVLAL